MEKVRGVMSCIYGVGVSGFSYKEEERTCKKSHHIIEKNINDIYDFAMSFWRQRAYVHAYVQGRMCADDVT